MSRYIILFLICILPNTTYAVEPKKVVEKRFPIFSGKCQVRKGIAISHNYRTRETVTSSINDQFIGNTELKFEFVYEEYENSFVPRILFYEASFNPPLVIATDSTKIYISDIYSNTEIDHNYIILAGVNSNLSIRRTSKNIWHGSYSTISLRKDRTTHISNPVKCKIADGFPLRLKIYSEGRKLKQQFKIGSHQD
jgi:hypothetical protein